MQYMTRTSEKKEKGKAEATEKFQVAFFDIKQYDIESFEKAIAQYQERNKSAQIVPKWFEEKLDSRTVHFADKSQAVCCFVNDTVDRSVIERLSRMGVKQIVMRCAGYNNVDLKAAKTYGIPVVRVPAYSPNAVAEHAVALLMTLNRKIHKAYNRTREMNFSLTGLVGFDLGGSGAKTVGVIGTGKIGQIFAKIMTGFGCKVLLFDLYPNKQFADEIKSKYCDSLDEIWEHADVISLHVPLFDSNKHMINANSLKKMKKGVVIINTSRGPLVDTEALIEALKTGHVAGAGLDVYEFERSLFFSDKSGEVLTDDILARLTSFK
tara:strand:- start:783 stop:1748 length:966 start_codon:yes stop_codon:yes gene_type:complete